MVIQLPLKSSLRDYLDRQLKLNENSQLDEEIDFQGLFEFIDNNLIDDVEKRIGDPSRKIRKESRNTIINKAVSYACADKPKAKKRVEYIVGHCLDIIKKFYKSKFSIKEYILVNEIDVDPKFRTQGPIRKL